MLYKDACHVCLVLMFILSQSQEGTITMFSLAVVVPDIHHNQNGFFFQTQDSPFWDFWGENKDMYKYSNMSMRYLTMLFRSMFYSTMIFLLLSLCM